MAEHSNAPPLGTVLGGAYQLRRFLGAGGMGAVYDAVDANGTHVAVKVLLAIDEDGQSDEIRERFKREIAVTGALNNPHVVGLIDGGLDPTLDLAYMVMPLLVGLDLEQLVERIGPVHPALAVRLIRQACRALTAAHDAGIVHRDIKAANLYLDHDRAGNVTVRVLDFGIAKWRAADTNLTRTGSTFGTPDYMSPEQTQSGKHVDGRTDLWSLAITLYHALSTTHPFAEVTNVGQLLVSILTRDTPSIQDVAPWIEPELAQVLHGALVRDRDARCPTVAAWAELLEPFAYGSDEVTEAMLIPLAPEYLAYRARPATLPASWDEVLAAQQPKLGQPRAAQPSQLELTLAPAEGAPDPLIGATLAGRFTLLRVLGTGGMGTVYEAADAAHNRVAIKVLDVRGAGASQEARERFVREARTTMSLSHDNVVRVLEAGTDADRQLPFIVMELLHGMDLGALIERHGALPPEQVAQLFRQACRGLSEAHARNLVHRDIKPANLFLHALPSGTIVVKICDFGLAKNLAGSSQGAQDTNLTRTGGMMGSPAFMSPEQATSAKHVDHRTDIWSLGVSLYQALTGVGMWEGAETVGQVIVAICTAPIPGVQDRATWIVPELAQVVSRAVQRKPEDRYQTIDELFAALEPFAGGDSPNTFAQLGPVSQQLRSFVAARAEQAPQMSLGGNVSQVVAQPEKRRSGAAIAAGAFGLLALVGVGTFVAFGRGAGDAATAVADDARTEAPAPSGGASSEPPGGRVAATVTVLPATATVTVDGAEQLAPDGTLTLSGEPGDVFQVVVETGGQKLEKTVIISKDGKASPDKLELEQTTATTSSSGPLISPSAARPAGPLPRVTASGARKPPPPKATASGGEVEARDDW